MSKRKRQSRVLSVRLYRDDDFESRILQLVERYEKSGYGVGETLKRALTLLAGEDIPAASTDDSAALLSDIQQMIERIAQKLDGARIVKTDETGEETAESGSELSQGLINSIAGRIGQGRRR